MDVFKNKIPLRKFRATNAAWNELTLNSPWSVGYVASLIESRDFKSKEEWEAFYYQSGADRNAILAKETEPIRKFMNFHVLKKTKPENIKKTPPKYQNLNFNYGRTPGQLAEKGAILFEKMQETKVDISLRECVEAVRFRVICETWNGIVIRERNTIQELEKQFPNLVFEKTSGEFDHLYAVDYQVFKFDKLVCGP